MHNEKSLVSIMTGLLFFFCGLVLLICLKLALFVVSMVDGGLSIIERWINYRFDEMYGDW